MSDTDLVDRLREMARKAQAIEEHGLLSLAADEIERLTKENDRLKTKSRELGYDER